MSIYNIKDSIESENFLSNYDSGNKRDLLSPRPPFGLAEYTECEYKLLNGSFFQINSCREPTIAQYGSQPSDDIMSIN